MRALLVLVAHHPPAEHVQRLSSCLNALAADVAYAVVVNIAPAKRWSSCCQGPA